MPVNSTGRTYKFRGITGAINMQIVGTEFAGIPRARRASLICSRSGVLEKGTETILYKNELSPMAIYCMVKFFKEFQFMFICIRSRTRYI